MFMRVVMRSRDLRGRVRDICCKSNKCATIRRYDRLMTNLRLRYSRPEAADAWRPHVDVKLPGPFEFEGREWVAKSVENDGFTLCTEHERTFNVLLDDSIYIFTGPRPETGEIVTLDRGGPRICVSDVAVAHHETSRGSLRGERIDS
jgi:hypothetical protein